MLYYLALTKTEQGSASEAATNTEHTQDLQTRRSSNILNWHVSYNHFHHLNINITHCSILSGLEKHLWDVAFCFPYAATTMTATQRYLTFNQNHQLTATRTDLMNNRMKIRSKPLFFRLKGSSTHLLGKIDSQWSNVSFLKWNKEGWMDLSLHFNRRVYQLLFCNNSAISHVQ